MTDHGNVSSSTGLGPCGTDQAPNPLISEIYDNGFVRDRTNTPTRNLMNSAIPYDQGMTFYKWIRKTKPHRTLEIGMAYGLSTLFICQAHTDNAEDGYHIAIDPYQDKGFGSIGLLNVQRAKLEDRLTFFEAPSYEVLPQLLGQ